MGPRYVFQLLYNFNHKIANNSATLEAKEKNKRTFGTVKNLEKMDGCLTELKNNQILLNKISHQFKMTTKLFTPIKLFNT
jgi:hypothetical protein